MNKARLAILIENLRAAHERAQKEGAMKIAYDQDAFFYNPEGLDVSNLPTKPLGTFKKIVQIKEGACGSTACVLGQAAMIPKFNRAGLNYFYEAHDAHDGLVHHMQVVFKKPGAPSFECDTGFRAGAKFFGLDYDDASILFNSTDNAETVMFYANVDAETAVEICDDINTNGDGPFYERVNLGVVADRLQEYVDTKGKNLAAVKTAWAAYNDEGEE